MAEFSKMEMDPKLTKYYNQLKSINCKKVIVSNGSDYGNINSAIGNSFNADLFKGKVKESTLQSINSIYSQIGALTSTVNNLVSDNNKIVNVFAKLELIDNKIKEHNAAIDELNALKARRQSKISARNALNNSNTDEVA